MEIEPSQLPSTGVFLSYTSPAPSNVNVIEVPCGSLLKVPVAVARQRCLQVSTLRW